MLLCETNCSTSGAQQCSVEKPASLRGAYGMGDMLLGLRIEEDAGKMSMTLKHGVDLLSQGLRQVWTLNLHYSKMLMLAHIQVTAVLIGCVYTVLAGYVRVSLRLSLKLFFSG